MALITEWKPTCFESNALGPYKYTSILKNGVARVGSPSVIQMTSSSYKVSKVLFVFVRAIEDSRAYIFGD